MSTSLPKPSSRPSTPNKATDRDSKYLPPSRKTKGVVDVHPPLYHTPLTKIIYWLVFLLAIVGSVYTYRLLQWKTQAGGWFNLMLGRHPNEPLPNAPTMGGPGAESAGKYGTEGLEFKIRNLADELGIHPRELASAIKPLLPTASVSSIASASPTKSGTVVGVLADGDQKDEKAAGYGFGLGSVVGMEEPLDMMD